MADTKGSDLTQITTIADGDGVYVVDDLGGTPVSKLITFANFIVSLAATFYYAGNVVGTVSESGGTPTGAVIEAGSNANGNYTKWADGTMICTHDLVVGAPNVAIGNVFRTASTDWTYPVAFVSGSPPSNSAITTSGVAYSWGGMGASAATVTVAKFVGVNSGTSGTSMTLAVTAVGRWF